MNRATKRLSARKVETIRTPGYHADGEGLYLVVDQSGARRWAFIYHTHGKRREMGLGRMGLKGARETADEVRHRIRKGIDPITARQLNRSNTASIPTFEDIAAKVIADAQARSTNDKVRYQWELLLGPSYCDSLLRKPINQITTLDIERSCALSGGASLKPVASCWCACAESLTMPVFNYGTGTASLCRATRLLGRICGTVGLSESVS
jgi:Arm DNA-binding domain